MSPVFGAGVPFECPQLPRRQVHQTFGVDDRGIEIVRIAPREIAHGPAEGARERRAVGFRICRVSSCERLDIIALDIGPALSGVGGRVHEQRLRFRERVVRRLRARVVYVEVVVRAERPRLAPVRHGCEGIELCSALERSDRGFVIEAEGLRQPLVEHLLRFGIRCSYRMVMLPEAERLGRRGRGRSLGARRRRWLFTRSRLAGAGG